MDGRPKWEEVPEEQLEEVKRDRASEPKIPLLPFDVVQEFLNEFWPVVHISRKPGKMV